MTLFNYVYKFAWLLIINLTIVITKKKIITHNYVLQNMITNSDIYTF